MAYYDPNEEPDPDEWLAESEEDRIDAARRYHVDHDIDVPDVFMHAMIHATVENQVAAGDPPETAEAVDRLIRQGLDRHEAVHAVGYVLAQHMFRMVKGTRTGDTNAAYVAALRQLTAGKWTKRR